MLANLDAKAVCSTSGRLLTWAVALGALAFGCGGLGAVDGDREAAGSEAEEGTVSAEARTSDASAGTGVVATVTLNEPPLFTKIWFVREDLRDLVTGEISGEVEIEALAQDPDGDDLEYAWTSPTCAGAEVTVPDPSHPNRALVRLDSWSAPCEVEVLVTDHWRGHLPPVPSLPAARGGAAVGRIHLLGHPTPGLIAGGV